MLTLAVALAGLWSVWDHDGPQSPRLSPGTRAALQQAQIWYRDANYDQGIEVINAQLAREPEAPVLHYMLGVLLGSKGDVRAAVAQFEEEIRRDPTHLESYEGPGTAYTRLGELGQANSYFEKCLRLRPDYPDVSFQLGRNLVELGRYQEAEKHLLTAARANNADAYAELGLAYQKLDRKDRALEAFRQALAIEPGHLGATFNLGQTLVRLGRKEEGEQFLQRHAELAQLADEAAKYKQASQLSGATAMSFLLLAQSYLQQEKFPEAISAFERALGRNPNLLPAALGLAGLYLDLDRLDDAMQWTRRALQIDPDNSTGYFLLGLIDVHKAQLAEAQTAFDTSRRFGSWTSDTYWHLGDTYERGGHFTEALAAYNQSLALDSRHAMSYYSRARVLYRQHHLARANADLDRAVRLDPSNDEIQMLLGVVHYGSHHRAAARAAFREAIRLQRVTVIGQENVEKMLQRFTSLPDVEPALSFYRQLRPKS